MTMKNSLLAIIGLLGMALVIQRAQGLDFSQRIVCGTNEQNEIWCTNYVGMEHGRWERVPGSLKQVLVRDGHIWGVSPDGKIWYVPDLRSPKWMQLRGYGKEISEGHGLLCVVNEKDEVWCADRGINTPDPNWKKAPDGARLKFVSIN
jgi:hypothetical protein